MPGHHKPWLWPQAALRAPSSAGPTVAVLNLSREGKKLHSREIYRHRSKIQTQVSVEEGAGQQNGKVAEPDGLKQPECHFRMTSLRLG